MEKVHTMTPICPLVQFIEMDDSKNFLNASNQKLNSLIGSSLLLAKRTTTEALVLILEGLTIGSYKRYAGDLREDITISDIVESAVHFLRWKSGLSNIAYLHDIVVENRSSEEQKFRIYEMFNLFHLSLTAHHRAPPNLKTAWVHMTLLASLMQAIYPTKYDATQSSKEICSDLSKFTAELIGRVVDIFEKTILPRRKVKKTMTQTSSETKNGRGGLSDEVKERILEFAEKQGPAKSKAFAKRAQIELELDPGCVMQIYNFIVNHYRKKKQTVSPSS
ncbi:unnamed protein product [Caenorhabditis sp. 36 PRJEB53466]|nr:unnamed protein product [Caenorhabditis sp. 36 PRJEB53466]